MSLKLTDLLEGMSDEEFANAQAFDRLSKDDQDKLAAIRQMMSNEKEMEIIKKMAPKTDMKSLRKLSKMEEDLFSKDGGNEDNVDNIDKVASPSAKANDYSAAVSSNRSEDSAEQAGTTKTTKPMYNENKGMSLVDLAKKLGIDVDELEAKIMKFKGKEKDEIEAGARASMAEENDEEKMPMDEEGKGYKEYEDDVEKEKLAKAGDLKEEADPIEAEMKMHLKQYNAGNIDGDDLAKAFDEILNGRISPPGERGFNTRYGMEESYGVTDQDPEDDVVNVDKVSSPSAKGTGYGAETSSNDNEDNQEDKEIANPKPMYTENGEVDDFAKEIAEADPIPTEKGITKMGDDGKEYGVRASNHDRKMAMRNVIDILRDELSVNTSDAFDYIRTHKDDLFNGEVDAYDKDEVIADYKEYESVNVDSVEEMESLREHFNRFM